jgi:hypothetical protein
MNPHSCRLLRWHRHARVAIAHFHHVTVFISQRACYRPTAVQIQTESKSRKQFFVVFIMCAHVPTKIYLYVGPGNGTVNGRGIGILTDHRQPRILKAPTLDIPPYILNITAEVVPIFR